MIADPRFSRFTREFAVAVAEPRQVPGARTGPQAVSRSSRATRAPQLRQEPVEFLQYLIRNNLPVRNLIASDFVVANEVVASYYDLGGQDRERLPVRADPRTAGRELGGVLDAGRRSWPGCRTAANRTR